MFSVVVIHWYLYEMATRVSGRCQIITVVVEHLAPYSIKVAVDLGK